MLLYSLEVTNKRLKVLNYFSCIVGLLVSGTCFLQAEEELTVAFGSCHKGTKPFPVLDTIVEQKPDIFIWVGDNIYGDSKDVAVLRKKYDRLLNLPSYQKLATATTIIGTWDDHDYGKDNAGKEFPAKEASQKEFLRFLKVPKESLRWQREGVYSLFDLGEGAHSIRFILLDTRYHRDELGSDGTILGEEQWRWLEESLVNSPASVNVMVSSIQVLPKDHRFEKWDDFPKERQRLLALLARPEVPPVVLLSGDRHLSEISEVKDEVGYPLVEVTSSSLNLPFGGRPDEVNQYRLGPNFRAANWGMLTISWDKENVATVAATVRDVEGKAQLSHSVRLLRLAKE